MPVFASHMVAWLNGRALDLGSNGCRFESCRDRYFFLFSLIGIKCVTGAGFEPAPPKRPELGSGALDHSAILSQVKSDEGGVRTHASEEIAALTQRLRPLGHLATHRRSSKVHPLGFEPRTFAVLKRRHNQLDHGCPATHSGPVDQKSTARA